jgi:transcriptional regulator with XRE-family HTH domain
MIGKAIKQLRWENYLSQRELAEKCGMNNCSLSLIENGLREPSSKSLKKIASVLRLEVSGIYLKAEELCKQQ